MTGGFGLFGVEESNIFKVNLKVLDELGGEGDFRN